MLFHENGYTIHKKLLDAKKIDIIKSEIESSSLLKSKGGFRAAEKKFSSIKALVNSPAIFDLARRHLHSSPSFVRAIVFHKSFSNNWQVPWHQDKTVCVSQQFQDKAWGPWSRKEGSLHVQAPLEVLEKMVTLRISLDGETSETGCLKLIPKSHKQGLLNQQSIEHLAKSEDIVDCHLNAGDGLLMRPHILH